MTQILHILTRSEDPTAREVIQRQQNNASVAVTVIDLSRPDPDYSALVTTVFASDAVQVW